MAKTFNTLTAFTFPLFCGTKSLHHRLRLRKRFVGWNWLLCGSALKSPILLYKVHSLFSALRQSSGQNIQHTHCIYFSSFLWDQVFASQIKTKEEICWVKLTPLWISSTVTHNSCTKSTLCSAHKDSPVAETFNTLTAFTFPLFCGTKPLHNRLRLRKRFVGWQWVWLFSASALNPPCLVQSPLSVQRIKTVQWPKNSAHSLHFLFFFFVGPSLCITD